MHGAMHEFFVRHETMRGPPTRFMKRSISNPFTRNKLHRFFEPFPGLARFVKCVLTSFT